MTASSTHPVRRVLGVAGALALVTLAIGVVWFLRSGYGLYIVHTGSMTPTYDSGDLVVERSGLAYGRGDVITFEHGAGPKDLVTHRITKMTDRGISTKGDGNRTADVWRIDPAEVHGRVVGHLPNMGYAAYYLQQPAGVGSVMTGALALFLLWGLCFPVRRPEGDDESSPGVPRQRRGTRLVLPGQRQPDEGALDPVTG